MDKETVVQTYFLNDAMIKNKAEALRKGEENDWIEVGYILHLLQLAANDSGEADKETDACAHSLALGQDSQEN